MRRAWLIATLSPHLPILGFLVAFGLQCIVTPPPVMQRVSPWLEWPWVWSMIVGGLLAIFGCVTERTRGESVGLSFCLVGLALYIVTMASGWLAVTFLALMCVSRMWTLHQARRNAARLTRLIEER